MTGTGGKMGSEDVSNVKLEVKTADNSWVKC